MKKIATKFIGYLCMIVNVIYKYENYKILKKRINKIFSLWVKNEFNFKGQKIHIEYPIYLEGGKYITISDNFKACSRLRIEAWDNYQNTTFNPKINIGKNVTLNYNVHIGCINNISIGNNVLMGSNILIIDHSHGELNKHDLYTPPSKRKLFSKGGIIIGDNVWIGDNVSILPGVEIGDNCVIAAGAVVNKNFEANSIIGGIPARILKTI